MSEFVTDEYRPFFHFISFQWTIHQINYSIVGEKKNNNNKQTNKPAWLMKYIYRLIFLFLHLNFLFIHSFISDLYWCAYKSYPSILHLFHLSQEKIMCVCVCVWTLKKPRIHILLFVKNLALSFDSFFIQIVVGFHIKIFKLT